MSSDRVLLEKKVRSYDAKEKFKDVMISITAQVKDEQYPVGRVLIQDHNDSKHLSVTPEVAAEIYFMLGEALKQIGVLEDGAEEELEKAE